MAAWNLVRGAEVARLLAARWPDRWAALRAALDLSDDELDHWTDVSARLVTGRVRGGPLIEQFAGYFDRAAVALPPVPPLPAADDIARIGRTQAIKQPDVVLLLALLPEQYSRAVAKANFRYFEPRTAHGSSLSPSIHALVAARLGDVETAARYFRQAMTIDLDEDEDAAQGVHLGALGGLWMAAVLGFGGLSLEPDGIRLDPHLPPAWQALRFPLRWRDRACRVEAERSPQHRLRLCVTLGAGGPLTVSVGDLRATLRAGETWRCEWDETDQRWKEAA
jgi:kojibiose phosphorylase